jgi:hypothetical protein
VANAAAATPAAADFIDAVVTEAKVVEAAAIVIAMAVIAVVATVANVAVGAVLAVVAAGKGFIVQAPVLQFSYQVPLQRLIEYLLVNP